MDNPEKASFSIDAMLLTPRFLEEKKRYMKICNLLIIARKFLMRGKEGSKDGQNVRLEDKAEYSNFLPVEESSLLCIV